MTTPHPDLTPDALPLPPRPWYVSALLALSAVVLLIAGAWGVAAIRSLWHVPDSYAAATALLAPWSNPA